MNSTWPADSSEARSARARGNRSEALVISICGMAGSGKSTVAKKLAEKYHLRFFSGGDALKALAFREGFKTYGRGWWESKEGLRFIKMRQNDHKYDKQVDDELLRIADNGNVVFDSWTMPWLLKKGFKIWLEAPIEKRAQRIAQRDKISLAKALQSLKDKESRTKMIYKRLYGFRLGEDFEPFHFVLDTNNLNADEVFQVLSLLIEKTLLSSAIQDQFQKI